MSYDATGLNFIPGLLDNMNRYIEVADGHHSVAKQKGQVKLKFVKITEILLLQHCTCEPV